MTPSRPAATTGPGGSVSASTTSTASSVGASAGAAPRPSPRARGTGRAGGPGLVPRTDPARRLAAARRAPLPPVRVEPPSLDAHGHAHGGAVSVAGADGGPLLRCAPVGRQDQGLPG